MSPPLKDDSTVIEMDGKSCPGEFGNRYCAARVFGIQLIDEALAPLYESACPPEAALILLPIRSVKVLNHVDAVLAQARVQELEGSRDVTHEVASIIEHDVRPIELVDHALQKDGIALIARPDEDLILLQSLAAGIGVYPDNLSKWAKITLP